MPTVPEYGYPHVAEQNLPSAREQIDAPSAAFGAATAQATQQLGQQGQQVSSQLAQLAAQNQKQDNQAAVWDAYTKLSDQVRQYTYDPNNGVMTKTGADALGSTSKAATDIGNMAQTISSGLQNEEQRQLFHQMYQRRLSSDLDGLARHEASQRQSYLDNVSKGVVQTSQQDAATRWNDPTYIQNSADMAETAIVGRLKQQGAPTELISAQAEAVKSGVWKNALIGAIQSDPLQAKSLLDKYKDNMTGSDVLDVEKALKVPYLNAKATAIAGQINTPGVKLPGDVSSKIAAAANKYGVDVTTALTVAQIENPSGDPLVKNPNSSASGIYQMTDGTWKAMGGTAANRKDVDAQIELGMKNLAAAKKYLTENIGHTPSPAELYLAHQQGAAGAAALINAKDGESAIDALTAVYKGDRAKAELAVKNNGGNDNMTAADFVQKWAVRYDKQAGATADGSQAPLSEQIAAAKALAGDDEDLQKAAVAKVVSQYNTNKAALKADSEQALQNVYQHYVKTGTVSGANAADLAKLTPQQLISLQKVQHTTNWAYYDKFMGMPQAEKQKVPLTDLMSNLGPTELKEAFKERSGVGGTSHWLQSRGTILQNFAKESGIIPSSGSASAKQEAQYNAFSAYMNQKMTDYRAKHNAEMTESEFRSEAAKAVTNVVTQQGTFFDTKKHVFELNGQNIQTIGSVSDIPVEMQNSIKTVIAKNGKTETDALVLALAKAWVQGDKNAAKLILDGAK